MAKAALFFVCMLTNNTYSFIDITFDNDRAGKKLCHTHTHAHTCARAVAKFA